MVYANGYATNITFLDCACKWDKKDIAVWIENFQEEKYTNLVTEAFDSWQTNFPQLHYTVYTNYTEKWDIRVKIVDKYLDEEELRTLAKTDIIADWSDNNIEKVSVIIPTHIVENVESDELQFTRMKDVMFYNVILHEIGHAIGLGHANENEEGLIDPMFKYMNKDEERRIISKLDTMTLERLYR
jgi:predicted Zn-dependent protease